GGSRRRIEFGDSSPSRSGGPVMGFTSALRRRPTLSSVALLVLLARAARAGIVAADLGGLTLDRLDLGVLSARGRGAVGVVHVGRRPALRHGHRSPPRTGRSFSGGFGLFPRDRLQLEEVLDDLVLDPLLHECEE